MKSLLEMKRGPWATFRDQLDADDRERRHDAMLAVIRWPGVDPVLLIDARREKANPGSEWDRRGKS